MKDIIVISGPTATGKTSTSIKIAMLKGFEVVNFDSLVFYKELSIGTAKPTAKEMQGVPHHLVGSESILSPLNAADFQEKSIKIINSIHQSGKGVVLVGGSGFYLQTLLNGMYKGGSTPKEIIKKSDILYNDEGIEPFREILKDCDPVNYDRYHKNDHYRIRRAVEFFWSTNTPFSDQRKNMAKYPSPVDVYKWNITHVHLDINKEEHFEIIQKRSAQMIEDGLVKEVKDLLNEGYSKELKPLKSIGYKETIAFIEGQFETPLDYKERIDISTRQLAKAQRTWFKKMNLNSFDPLTQFDSIIKYIDSK